MKLSTPNNLIKEYNLPLTFKDILLLECDSFSMQEFNVITNKASKTLL